MIELRPFTGLGGGDHGWLKARHHFSFADYQDPQRVHWGALRVWNDDEIAPGTGFPPHPHRDMEIVTYVREGAITHEDSLGNSGRTEAGDVQVMSAGAGLRHAEYNRESGTTRIFQIWIIPDARGGTPVWGQRRFPRGARAGRFVPLASGRAEDDAAAGKGEALPIRADARVLGATLSAGDRTTYRPAGSDPGRHLYLVAARGRVTVDGVSAGPRDGIAISDEARIVVEALDDAELVLVDAA